MTSDITRLPKWMKAEVFAAHYSPIQPHFTVYIWDDKDPQTPFIATGNSIAEAGKEARKKRNAGPVGKNA